jgi:hypothetical protein
MICPAILSLEDFRDTPRRGEIRQRLHDRFDHWRNRLEDRMKAPTPTLEELTQAVLALRQELTPEVTEGLVAQTHRTLLEQRTVACPQSASRWRPVAPRSARWRRWWGRSGSGARTFTASLVSVERPRWTRRCS